MGMTYNEFWLEDSSLVKDYRKAFKIRMDLEQDKQNQFAWLQGMYIYEALCDVTPVMHAFAKRGARPMPYPQKPYDLHPQEETKRKETPKESQENQIKRNVAMMQSLAAAFNKNFQKREEEKKRREQGSDKKQSKEEQPDKKQTVRKKAEQPAEKQTSRKKTEQPAKVQAERSKAEQTIDPLQGGE